MFNKTYELPLSRNYVQHWGVAEAVRELLQNALDSDSPLEWNFGPDHLTITSRNARLEPRSLLLGTTSKSESSDKIGQFGEGYKIALLVLTRANRAVIILNNELKWEPFFRFSKTFEEEVLTIEETRYPEGRGKGLHFIIEDLSEDDISQIKLRTLHMQESIGEVIETSKGRILRNRPGQLFVKGLFVCETDMKFGYDIKPEFLKLERDRQTVSGFDLAWLAKDMWFESGRTEEIQELMFDKVPDLEYAQYSTPEVVKEACYQHFVKKHPGSVCVETQQELDALVKQGMSVVIYSGSYGTAVRSAPSYHREVKQVIAKTPADHLAEWFTDNRSEMRTKAIVSFKTLLTQANKWRLK